MKLSKTMAMATAMGLLLTVLFVRTAGADLVSMRNKGSYWKIVLDYTGGITHYEMGFAYGRALADHFPELPARIDRYLAQSLSQEHAERCISRFASLDVPEAYIQELNGIADAMKLTEKSRLGDGKLSRVEFFLNNQPHHSARQTQAGPKLLALCASLCGGELPNGRRGGRSYDIARLSLGPQHPDCRPQPRRGGGKQYQRPGGLERRPGGA